MLSNDAWRDYEAAAVLDLLTSTTRSLNEPGDVDGRGKPFHPIRLHPSSGPEKTWHERPVERFSESAPVS